MKSKFHPDQEGVEQKKGKWGLLISVKAGLSSLAAESHP